jgi:hypothetical protein
MGWDKGGRYYTRSQRENGRVIREYIGGGAAGALVAQLDAIDRDRREEERVMARLAQEEVEALDAPLLELDALCDQLARAALLAAGYRQHHRGEWRKARGRRD